MTDITLPAVPGIPLAALDAVTDPNARDLLRALVDSHHVRNGQSGSGDNRFITASELDKLATSNARFLSGSGTSAATQGPIKTTDVTRIINDLMAQIVASPLYTELAQRVGMLDAPLGRVDSVRKNLADAANKAMLEFDAAAAPLGDGVTELSKLFDASITQTRAIKKTLYSPDGTLPLASAAILEINTVDVTSKSANARTLAGLSTKVNNPETGLEASRADYINRINTEAGLRAALASSLTTLNAQVNDPGTGLAASRAQYTQLIATEAGERSAVASALSGLTAVVINPATQRPYTEGMIADDRAINLTNFTALAQQNQSVYAAIGVKNRTYFASSAPAPVAATPGSPYQPARPGVPAVPAVAPTEATPQVGDIWYDTANNNMPRRWNGSAWLDTSDTRAAAAAGLVNEERGVRLGQDSALASAISTVWGALGGNSGLIQVSDKVTVNPAGATATRFEQVQSALRDSNGNLIASAAIKQTTETLVDKAGQVEAKWVLNLDAGGVATGYRQAGFGIAGSASANGPQYAFGVRADTFWIAAPGDSVQGVAPATKVPFIVRTNDWVDSQGVVQPAGTYLNELFAASAKIGFAQIRTAHIADAQVNTLKIGANSVTVPVNLSGNGPGGISSGQTVFGGQVAVVYPDWADVVAIANWKAAAGDPGGNTGISLRIDGGQFAYVSDSNVSGFALSHTATGRVTVSPGYHVFSVYFDNAWYEGNYDLGAWSVTFLGVMR